MGGSKVQPEGTQQRMKEIIGTWQVMEVSMKVQCSSSSSVASF